MMISYMNDESNCSFVGCVTKFVIISLFWTIVEPSVFEEVLLHIIILFMCNVCMVCLFDVTREQVHLCVYCLQIFRVAPGTTGIVLGTQKI